MSISAILSYVLRKPKGNWGVPMVLDSFKITYLIIILISLLGILFPLFGLRFILITILIFIKKVTTVTVKN